MRPEEFLSLAQRLVAHGTEAADFRTAVSRAYYAAYHAAFVELERLGCVLRTDRGGHKDVLDFLDNSGVGDLQEISTKLANLHGARREADYRLHEPRFEKGRTAGTMVEQARRLISDMVSRCRKEDRHTIAATMAAYATTLGRSTGQVTS
jgi:uncharacterized protein (UPF0332 family)